jgi:cytochrome P450
MEALTAAIPEAVAAELGAGTATGTRAGTEIGATGTATATGAPAATETDWPDTANRLLFRLTADLLVDSARDPATRALLAEVFERAVLAGARDDHSRRDRARFRRRAFGGLAEAVRRCRHDPQPPRDLLGVVARAAGDAPDRDVAEVFVSHVFALTGSVGFALGWSVLLTGGRRPEGVRTAWIVREALRLWPVAWMFGRTVARDHELGGTELRRGDDVMVCSYLVHRHPGHWPEPDAFQPGRWAELSGPPAYLPFGWGPHSCTGAAVALDLIEGLLDEILRYELRLTRAPADADRPRLGPALAPPPFRVRAAARAADTESPGRR